MISVEFWPFQQEYTIKWWRNWVGIYSEDDCTPSFSGLNPFVTAPVLGKYAHSFYTIDPRVINYGIYSNKHPTSNWRPSRRKKKLISAQPLFLSPEALVSLTTFLELPSPVVSIPASLLRPPLFQASHTAVLPHWLARPWAVKSFLHNNVFFLLFRCQCQRIHGNKSFRSKLEDVWPGNVGFVKRGGPWESWLQERENNEASLHSKRFQSNYSAKVRAGAKKIEGEGGGEKRKRLPANTTILENAPWYLTVRFICKLTARQHR